MNGDKINRWLSLEANVGVIAGLVFVAMEIQTNTESNIIAVEANYSVRAMAKTSAASASMLSFAMTSMDTDSTYSAMRISPTST